MRKIGLSLASLAVLTGCSSLEGYARRPDDPAYITAKRSTYFSSNAQSSREQDYIDETDPIKRRTIRDEIVYARMDVIEFDFDNLERELNSAGNGISLGGDLAVLVANGIGATTGGKQTKATLNAISGGIVGAQGTINKDLYYQKTLPALLSQMEANRDRVKAEILAGLARPDAEYPLGAAQLDLRRLVRAGSIPASVGEITQKATADKHDAADQVQMVTRGPEYVASFKQRSEISRRIRALTDEQVTKLASVMAPHFGERGKDVQDKIGGTHPEATRTSTPKLARYFLLDWIIQDSDPNQLKQWIDALAAVEKGE